LPWQEKKVKEFDGISRIFLSNMSKDKLNITMIK